jgi:hypothetical protein
VSATLVEVSPGGKSAELDPNPNLKKDCSLILLKELYLVFGTTAKKDNFYYIVEKF